jgi:hypothetical protein
MHVQHVLSSVQSQVRRAATCMCLPLPVFLALRNTSSLSCLTAADAAVCGCSTVVAAYLSGITQAAAGAAVSAAAEVVGPPTTHSSTTPSCSVSLRGGRAQPPQCLSTLYPAWAKRTPPSRWGTFRSCSLSACSRSRCSRSACRQSAVMQRYTSCSSHEPCMCPLHVHVPVATAPRRRSRPTQHEAQQHSAIAPRAPTVLWWEPGGRFCVMWNRPPGSTHRCAVGGGL